MLLSWFYHAVVETLRTDQVLCSPKYGGKYRVIRNDCRGFNNLSYTINLRQEYVVAPMDLEIYVLPPPASIPELKVRIRTAIETITADMLQTVWNELDYRVDVCRITKGAHIEHL